ncbi:laccase [Melanogaster broomeanus]|nr:laccase [Melanogaster broomeanus]
MLYLCILALSLLHTSYALSHLAPLDSDARPRPRPRPGTPNVLGPVADIHIANQFVAPDGFNRSATLINGVYPAPLIQAQKEDHFAIRVFNELTDATMPLETSIKQSNWADGVAFITQCPIRQDEAFLHQFTATTQTGTYWYHSHYDAQSCDGVKGPLVIYDPEDPMEHMYDVDDETTVITLSDWVTPDSTLINGQGRYPGGPLESLAVVNVTHGLRYRFRVLGLSCDSNFNFTIDGHRMTIIEADGIETLPVAVDSLLVFPGQRYSVVVTANQTVGNYWIRALSDQPGDTFDGGRNMAILRYKGAPAQDPTSLPGPYILSFSESDLHPLIRPGVPGIPEIGKADVNINIVPGFAAGAYLMNNVTFVNPPVPVLLQILSGARHPTELLPNGSVYELPSHKVIELSFPNNGAAVGGPHPIHLHGHRFDVIRVAGNSTPNFINPVRRDVTSIGVAGDNVTIRFSTDNSGPWFLHCHIDWHLDRGFAVVMAEAPEEAAEEQGAVIPGMSSIPVSTTADWEDLCLPGDYWGQTRLGTLGSRSILG